MRANGPTQSNPLSPVTPRQLEAQTPPIPGAGVARGFKKHPLLYTLGIASLFAGGGTGGYFGYRAAKAAGPSPTPNPTPGNTAVPGLPVPPASAAGVSLTNVFNAAFGTYYDNSTAGWNALADSSLVHLDVAQPTAGFLCDPAVANASCSPLQLLGGNAAQAAALTVVYVGNAALTNATITTQCKDNSKIAPQTFQSPLFAGSNTQQKTGKTNMLIDVAPLCENYTATASVSGPSTGAVVLDLSNSMALVNKNAQGQTNGFLLALNFGDVVFKVTTDLLP